MELTDDLKKEWELWLSERPESVRKVAQRIVPWKMYKLKSDVDDIGNRYIPTSYSEMKDGSVTLVCAKVNNRMQLLGGYEVFGINPNDLVEDFDN